MTHRILLVGGGSGGHIFPLIAVSKELQKIALEKGMNLELMAVADSNSWRSEFENLGIRFKRILAPKLRRFEGNLNLLDIFKIPISLIQSLWYIFLFMPDLVFAKGGYASILPVLVSKLYFIPLFIHDSDAVLKGANKFLSKFARKVFISFETIKSDLKNKEVILSGNPIREELLKGDRDTAGQLFKLSLNKKTILFLGGSQGAITINNLVIQSLVELSEKYQIIHQAGAKNFEYVKNEVDGIKKEGENTYAKSIEENYRLFDFMSEEELKTAYALADVLVSRAGANFIFEIASLGKPAIFIPYRFSIKNHQKANAMEIAKFGAVVLEEENLKPHILIDQIRHLADNPLAGEKIKQFAKPDAGKIIAEAIISHVSRQ